MVAHASIARRVRTTRFGRRPGRDAGRARARPSAEHVERVAATAEPRAIRLRRRHADVARARSRPRARRRRALAHAGRRGHGRRRRERLRARPPARASRRARPRDGLLPLQQRRGRRRAPARARTGSSACSSSTGTCTTATARRTCSTTIRTCSTSRSHQYPFYPGTGAAREVGARRRRGPHAERAAPRRLRRRGVPAGVLEVVVPVARAVPARVRARLAPASTRTRATRSREMEVTRARLRRWLARLLRADRRTSAGGRIVAVLEGGYDLDALGDGGRRRCSTSSRGARLDEPVTPPAVRPPRTDRQDARGRASHYWRRSSRLASDVAASSRRRLPGGRGLVVG